ncbi:C40 family peptidase [Candidatus Parcubacteria bacterium]|nr:C40 family peptidase [Candidatus Parcubacteria bacterium]
MTWIYRVGLSTDEISEEALKRSGLHFTRVNPREIIVTLANELIGVPYKFGSSVLKDSPNSFDCSSFAAYLYVCAGMAIPRICNDQYNFGKEVSEAEAQPGDLVFFKGQRTDIPPSIVGHEGVYIGDGEMIQAGGFDMGYGKVVKEKVQESKYFSTGFLGYRCLITDNKERFVIEIPEDRPELREKKNLIAELSKVRL